MNDQLTESIIERSIPIFWINLRRADRLRRCMEWSLAAGKWNHKRFEAIDAKDAKQQFIAFPSILKAASKFPGGNRYSESTPWRRTNRSELACLASWQHIIIHASEPDINSGSSYFLFMEDDVGSSLAAPDAWPVKLTDLITEANKRSEECQVPWTLIQLAPISSKVRIELHGLWEKSEGRTLLVPKENIRSHGNGAVLLHRRAFQYLVNPYRNLMKRFHHTHILLHPWAIRPVADKWIYASVPQKSVYVVTYPLFCLEAKHSELHQDHVGSFHQLSRSVTLEIWESDRAGSLIEAYHLWEKIE